MSPSEIEEAGHGWMKAMRGGDFAQAWAQTDLLERERRAARSQGQPYALQAHHLMWDGRSPEGLRVVVWCQHGLGDTIQFARFCPALRKLALEVTLMAQPPLVALLSTTPELGPVLNGWASDPPPHDLAVEIMELAYLLRTQPGEVGASVPYLSRDNIRQRAKPVSPHLLGPSPRVGLVWSASDWDQLRSLTPEHLSALTSLPGVSFHSFQQGDASDQATSLPMHRLSPHTAAPLDAAAAMLQMDLIITVDTFAAHLAGALGLPTWLLLRHQPDWRWREEGSETSWYPTLRLFRQSSEGDWSGVLANVACELRAWSSTFAAH